MKMNLDIGRKWIKELRSGNWTQTKGALHKEEGFCCLGVLTEMAVQAGVCKVSNFEDGIYFYDETYTASLPLSVVRWAGMDRGHPEIKGNWLATINDNGASFAEIADLIEQELFGARE